MMKYAFQHFIVITGRADECISNANMLLSVIPLTKIDPNYLLNDVLSWVPFEYALTA